MLPTRPLHQQRKPQAATTVVAMRGPKPPGTQPQNALWVVRGGAGPSLRFGGWPLAELPPTRGYALPPDHPRGGITLTQLEVLTRVPAPTAAQGHPPLGLQCWGGEGSPALYGRPNTHIAG